MEKFYKKNDIGVDIECYEVARCEDEGQFYRIYTNFFEDENPFGFKFLADRYENGQYYDDVPEEKLKKLVMELTAEIVNLVGDKNG